MKLLVINGPNLNLLGIREPEIYGNKTLADLERELREYCAGKDIELEFFQSNHEGAIVDRIQEAMGRCDGIIINPAAYTHTSIAIPDAIRASGIPAVEVHLSDIGSRESYRRISYTTDACVAVISGRHFEGYKEAVDIFRKKLYNELLANTK
ncbi:MAG TPA: type II 3-dehydroquinate dehydratase [Clostridiales bacterium]|jgi:3-dehydroquinate dehydratase-2|nr:type II 3-dehydroquinate dehydratase [Clostridiales bacterium]